MSQLDFRCRDGLLAGADLCRELVEVGDNHGFAVQLNEAFCLEAAEVTGYELANGADLGSKLLVADRKLELCPVAALS